jgi:hypothetical protein
LRVFIINSGETNGIPVAAKACSEGFCSFLHLIGRHGWIDPAVIEAE